MTKKDRDWLSAVELYRRAPRGKKNKRLEGMRRANLVALKAALALGRRK